MKTIFFTGATGGLGLPCVKALSERGYRVFAAGTNKEKLNELQKLPNVIPVHTDVTSQKSVEEARETVLSYTQTLYAVINFAGVTAFCSMIEGDCIAATEKLIQINVMGMVRVNRIFFDLVHAGGGRIINCSSEAGWMTPQPFAAPYYLSKRAVEAYSDSLRRELLYFGIPVVKIQPGSFKTGITDNILEQYEKTLRDTAYYKKVLTGMKPMMMSELKHSGDPKKLAKTLLKAVDAKHPKMKYRVGTGKLLSLMEILPEKCVDALYRLMFKR